MMSGQVLLVELLKLRRSKITWVSWIATSIMPLVCGLFTWIVREPERAAQLGLLGQKAEITGVTSDWSGYFALLLQTVGIGGTILVAVIAAYVYGREYSDATAKNLLALPVQRHWFVVAKLTVVLVWFGILILLLLAEAFLVGALLELPGFSTEIAGSGSGQILITAFVAWLLVPVVAWIATLGRGYLAPLGFTIFMLVMGMAVGATGWGKWFPWSIVPLFAGAAGPPIETLAPGSMVVLALTFLAGVSATILQMRYADDTQ
jgi:ABC-2 type transport system permease protein